MKTVTLQSLHHRAGLCFALALPLFQVGCSSLSYNDPNIPASARYFNTGGAQPANLTRTSPVNPAGVTPPSPVGVQPTSPVGVQPTSPIGLQTGPGSAGAGGAVSNALPLVGPQSSSKLGIGDLLTVNFSDVPQGSMPTEQEHRIGDDGLITLPHNVQVQAAGKTPTQLQKEIREAYVPSLFVSLTVVVKAKDRYVYVDGEVRAPSRQFHIDGLTVLRAISTAGGFTDFAKKEKIEVRRAIGGKTELVDWKKARKNPKLDLLLYVNDQVYVPRGVF